MPFSDEYKTLMIKNLHQLKNTVHRGIFGKTGKGKD